LEEVAGSLAFVEETGPLGFFSLDFKEGRGAGFSLRETVGAMLAAARFFRGILAALSFSRRRRMTEGFTIPNRLIAVVGLNA
jgi:hypothetical protein